MDRDDEYSLSFSTCITQPTTPFKSHVSTDNNIRPMLQFSTAPSFEFRRASTHPLSSPIYPQHSFIHADDKGSMTSPHKRCLRQGNEKRSADSVTKRVSFQGVDDLITPKHSVISRSITSESGNSNSNGNRKRVVVQVVEVDKAKRDGRKSKGLLGSIIFACRDCRAMEPSKRIESVAN